MKTTKVFQFYVNMYEYQFIIDKNETFDFIKINLN